MLSGGVLLDVDWQPYGTYAPPPLGSLYVLGNQNAVYETAPTPGSVVVSGVVIVDWKYNGRVV